MGQSTLIDVMIASIPGVVVALLSYYLGVINEARRARQLRQNTRRLIALEMAANTASLGSFWKTINALDTENQGQGAERHLAGIAGNGLLSYTAPRWTSTHWDHLSSGSAGSFSRQELEAIDAHYRGLPQIIDLFEKLIALTSDEREQLNRDRFWYNRFAGWRVGIFERLTAQVNAILTGASIHA